MSAVLDNRHSLLPGRFEFLMGLYAENYHRLARLFAPQDLQLGSYCSDVDDGLPVHLGSPSGMTGWADRVSSPKFATAVGLLHYARRLQHDEYAFAQLPGNNDSMRRVWGVPLEFDSSPHRGDQAVAENLFFDTSSKDANDSSIEKYDATTANFSETAKNWWHGFTKAIQPAVERVRRWLGFDVE